MSKNVSDQIVEFLTEIGVKYIYGIPGDTIDSLMESLRKQDKIKFVVTRHEEAAALAASAQAKLTGELAVCTACQGPGAVHLLNGLYDAAMDHAPVLAITGQVASNLIGSGMPQEINQIALFEEVALYNQELRHSDQVLPVFTSAVQAAKDYKGVAHISIPSDIMRMPISQNKPRYAALNTQYAVTVAKEALEQAASLLNAAQHITILYGDGARDASVEIIKLAETLKAPLVHTTRSKDVIDNQHPQYMGGIGLMGSRAGNYAVHECELLLVVGSSFAFHEYYPQKAQIIQIDHDPLKIAKHEAVTLGLVGDTKCVVTELISRIIEKNLDGFLSRCEKVRKLNDTIEAWEDRIGKNPNLIHPQTLTHKLNQYLPEDAVICTDAGSVTIWANNFLKLNGKQRYTWSANLASLGTGLAFAIGAQLAYPKRKVICLAGDGGFDMLIGDFATAVRNNMPILFIIYNNSAYGFIELEEQGEGNPIFGTKFTNPDFAALAKAFGAQGITVKNPNDLDTALAQGMQSNGPFLIDVYVNPKERYIPPVITPKMVEEFARSQIRSWFAKPSKADEIKL